MDWRSWSRCWCTADPRSGLMGALADSVLDAGRPRDGCGAELFIEAEFQHDGIDDLIVTSDMAERKAKMIELGDAFIAFPGGTGTLEEIAEVMSAVSLGHLNAPCILYNLDGYYNDLKALLEHMIDKGLSSLQRQQGIYFALTTCKRSHRSSTARQRARMRATPNSAICSADGWRVQGHVRSTIRRISVDFDYGRARWISLPNLKTARCFWSALP